MKNLLLIITLLISSCIAQAQNEIEKIASYDVPQGTEKPDKQKFQSYVANRKKTVINPKSTKGVFYKIGNILININAEEVNAKTNILGEKKKQYDQLYSELGSAVKYSSEIKTINGIKTLIQLVNRPENNYFFFTAVNKTNNKIFGGTVEFDKVDESKAATILNHIIASIKFK
jgi:cell division protein ZapA (FtsZ GTPase activity inhibitor)